MKFFFKKLATDNTNSMPIYDNSQEEDTNASSCDANSYSDAILRINKRLSKNKRVNKVKKVCITMAIQLCVGILIILVSMIYSTDVHAMWVAPPYNGNFEVGEDVTEWHDAYIAGGWGGADTGDFASSGLHPEALVQDETTGHWYIANGDYFEATINSINEIVEVYNFGAENGNDGGAEKYSQETGRPNTNPNETQQIERAMAGEEDPGPLVEAVAKLLWWCGFRLHDLLDSGGITSSYVVEDTSGTNIFHFTLEAGNVYGIAGAAIYVGARTICLGLIFVFTCYFLLRLALGAGARQRAEFKETILTVFAMMFLIYFFPRFADFAIDLGASFKDLITERMTIISSGSAGGISSVEDMLFNAWSNNENDIPMAILYLAFQGATIIFIAEYIGLSVATMLLFGVGPIIFLMATRDKGLLNKWVMTLIWNVYTPIFDTVLLAAIFLISDNVPGVTFTKCIIIIIALWNVIPARKAILAMLGGAQMGISSGVAGLGAIAGAFAGGLLGGKSGSKSSSKGRESDGGFLEDRNNAKMAEELGKASTSNSAIAMKELGSIGGVSNGTNSSSGSGISELTTGENAKSGGSYAANTIDAKIESDGSSSTGASSSKTYADDFSSAYEGMSSSEADVARATAADAEYSAPTLADIGDASRLSNLEDMDATGNEIAALNMGIANDSVSLEKLTSDIGSVDAPYNQLLEDYATLGALDTAEGIIEESEGKPIVGTEAHDKYNEAKEIVASTDRAALEDKISRQETALGIASTGTLAEKTSIVQQQKDANNAKVAELRNSIAQQKAQLATAKTNLSRQQTLENTFARQDKLLGGSGQEFRSAGQLKMANNLNAIKKRNISYKNFDTGNNEQLLSQSEKADFYRQRARHEAAENVINFTRSAAGVGVKAAALGAGVAASVAFAAGGPETIATIGKPISDMTLGVGNTGLDVGASAANAINNNAETIAAAGKYVGNTIKDIGKNIGNNVVYKTTGHLPGQGPKKRATKYHDTELTNPRNSDN